VINKSARICTPNFCCAFWARARQRRDDRRRPRSSARIFDAGRDLERPVRFLRRIGTFAQNLVAPMHCSAAALLLDAALGADYKATFPIAGVDGSLTERLVSPRLHNRIMAKTGSLAG